MLLTFILKLTWNKKPYLCITDPPTKLLYHHLRLKFFFRVDKTRTQVVLHYLRQFLLSRPQKKGIKPLNPRRTFDLHLICKIVPEDNKYWSENYWQEQLLLYYLYSLYDCKGTIYFTQRIKYWLIQSDMH